MKNILLLIFFFAIQVSAFTGEKGKIDYQKLEEKINKALKDYNNPGLAIAIVYKGEIKLMKGFGVLEKGKNTAVNESSLFGIASLSKAFTGLAAAQLAEQKKLNWDDKVTHHIPYFALHDAYLTQLVNIQDLLTHRVGLPTFEGDLLWYGTNYTPKQIIERIKYYPITQNFRASYGYQNNMFITAGEIIAKVSGKSFDQYLSDNIFKPLKMTRTFTDVSAFKSDKNIAMPHLQNKVQRLINYQNSAGTASIYSNVKDMSNWIKMWLNNGVFEKDTLLKTSSIQQIQSVHNPLGLGGFDKRNNIQFKGYGYGWFINDYNGLKVVHHDGGLPGYLSKMVLLPNENFGFVILNNDMTYLTSALYYQIMDEYLGISSDRLAEFKSYMDNGKTYEEKELKNRLESRIANTQASLKPNAIAGKYFDPSYGETEIKMLDGELIFTMLPTAELFTGKMEHWHYDTWKVQLNDPFLTYALITFQQNEKGEAIGFKIDLPNNDFWFDKLDFKKNK